MTTDDWSIIVSLLGFLGSLLLIYPGWRASRSLNTIESLRAVVDRPAHNAAGDTVRAPETVHPAAAEEETEAGHDPGPELVKILEEQHAAWRPLEHWLLITGIVLIILSFGADLFLVKLAN